MEFSIAGNSFEQKSELDALEGINQWIYLMRVFVDRGQNWDQRILSLFQFSLPRLRESPVQARI